MTTPALVAKQKGCNAFYAGLDDNSNVALATALQQEGVKPKVMVFPTGYEPGVIGSPAWNAVQGGYFETAFRPFSAAERRHPADAGGAREVRALHQPSEFPSFSQYESWLGADLMIKGLQLAGPNRDRTPRVITALRNLKSYNGNGLLPESLDYSTDFGHDLREVVRVVHEGREERLRRRLEPALVRDGPARHDDRLGVTRLGRARRSVRHGHGAPGLGLEQAGSAVDSLELDVPTTSGASMPCPAQAATVSYRNDLRCHAG